MTPADTAEIIEITKKFTQLSNVKEGWFAVFVLLSFLWLVIQAFSSVSDIDHADEGVRRSARATIFVNIILIVIAIISIAFDYAIYLAKR